MLDSLVRFVREQYGREGSIPLHAPVFPGRERDYLQDALASTFVSSIGAYVDRFETAVVAYAGARGAVATINGTAALHVGLLLAGVRPGDLVVTQPLTFVATCNAIMYCNAEPVFVDVERRTLGMSAAALNDWLSGQAILDDEGLCRTRSDGKIVRACVPMHTFGHPADLDGLVEVCKRWNVALVEDAAESLGSFYKGRHTGTFGIAGSLSFNGNKIITTGGGGMLLTDAALAERARHLTTTAKQRHPYESVHDEVGYNYRMPNLNAALGCAQLEWIERYVAAKRMLASRYEEFLRGSELCFVSEPADTRSNYWLNAVICEDPAHRKALLEHANERGVLMRPVWALMNHLDPFAHCRKGDLSTAEWLEARVVNLPSSPIPELL
jgi:aminotransferase in exopolysaccharide biosynthesis